MKDYMYEIKRNSKPDITASGIKNTILTGT